MKKIALIITDFDRLFSTQGIKGGGSHVLKNLIVNWIKDPNVTLDIYCSNTKTFEYEGINKIIRIPINQYADLNGFINRLEAFVSQDNYDNVLFGEVISPYGSVLLQAHSFLYRYDLYGGGLITKFFKRIKRKKIKAQERQFSKYNNVYIAMSEKVKKDYAFYFDIPEENIVVAYPGVTMPEVEPKEPNSTMTFGIVGSSNANKGAYKFIKAISKLKKHTKNFKAIMICNNYQRLYLMRFLVWLYKVEKYVEILDFQANMEDFYKQIDCIVMPSRHEAFGLVAIEGASHSAVPLVSNNTGFAEILDENENGFIFDINKKGIKNLTEKMKTIVDLYYNEKEKFNEIKYKSNELAKKYSWEGFSNKVLKNL